MQWEGWHLETSQHNTGLLSPANPLLAIHRRRVLYCTTGCIVVVVQKYIEQCIVVVQQIYRAVYIEFIEQCLEYIEYRAVYSVYRVYRAVYSV